MTTENQMGGRRSRQWITNHSPDPARTRYSEGCLPVLSFAAYEESVEPTGSWPLTKSQEPSLRRNLYECEQWCREDETWSSSHGWEKRSDLARQRSRYVLVSAPYTVEMELTHFNADLVLLFPHLTESGRTATA